MQVGDVLGIYFYIKRLLQLGKYSVPGIRLHFQRALPSLIVKIENQGRILLPSLRRCDFIDIVSFPKPVGIPERRNAAFSADSRSGKYHNPFHAIKLGKEGVWVD